MTTPLEVITQALDYSKKVQAVRLPPQDGMPALVELVLPVSQTETVKTAMTDITGWAVLEQLKAALQGPTSGKSLIQVLEELLDEVTLILLSGSKDETLRGKAMGLCLSVATIRSAPYDQARLQSVVRCKERLANGTA